MQIVFVEQSRTTQKALADLLAPHHEIIPYSDSSEALERVKREETIDAVITAAEFSPLSGLELCWELRLVAGEHRPMYLALMSSNLQGRTAVEALDVGVDDLLHKPPEREELHARLRSAERLLKLQRKLIQLANVDSLTGLLNRRATRSATRRSASSPEKPSARTPSWAGLAATSFVFYSTAMAKRKRKKPRRPCAAASPTSPSRRRAGRPA